MTDTLQAAVNQAVREQLAAQVLGVDGVCERCRVQGVIERAESVINNQKASKP